MKKCPKCKFPVADENEFCPYCKWKLSEPYQEISNPGSDSVQQENTREEMQRRAREAAEAANRAAEEKRRLEQEQQAMQAQQKDALRAALGKRLENAETQVNAQKQVTKRWTLLLIVFLIVAVAGYLGRDANKKTSYSERIPVEEFQPWSKDSKNGDGVTFRFTSLDDVYIQTHTTTYGSSRTAVSSLGTTTYKGYYLVSDASGQKAVLYASITGENAVLNKLTGFFPEIQILTIGSDEIPYLPEGTSPTAVGSYNSAYIAMDAYNLNASSKAIYNELSDYPFINLDRTSVYKEIPIEGAKERYTAFNLIFLIGAILCCVMLFLRKASVSKENNLRRSVNQLRSTINRL